MSCTVCSTSKYVSLHFGATVCAACAAFFRRTVAEEKTFKCQRDRNCSVDQAVRNVCRACRFARCLSVGMDVAEVQPKRDSSARGIQKRREAPVDIERQSVAVVPNHVNSGWGNTVVDQEINHWQFNANYALKEANHRQGYLLDEVIDLYHKLLDRRKFTLSDFKPLKSIFSNEQETPSHTQPFTVTKESAGLLTRRKIALIADFMQSLRPFAHFSPDDKFTLLKNFALEFCFVEGCYRTYLNNGFQTNSFTLATGEIVSLDKTDQFFNIFATAILDAATMKRLYHSMFIHGMRGLVEPMTAMKMTEREMLAFNLILLYSSQNATDLSPDQQNALIKARNEVLDDLHQYYCDSNIEDGEVRLGNLILLVPAVLDWLHQKKEICQITQIFEPNSTGDIWSELQALK